MVITSKKTSKSKTLKKHKPLKKLSPKNESSEIVKASAIIKKYAAKQKVTIYLTPAQEKAILKQWDDKDPYSPAQIIFKVGNKPIIDLKVAAYRYRGDTCCV